jgi:hypothetical protein
MKGVWGTDGKNDLERLKASHVYAAIINGTNFLI